MTEVKVEKTLIGLDAGNSQTKTLTRNQGLSIMPSAVLPAKAGPDMVIGGASALMPDTYRMRLDEEIEDAEYLFGETLSTWGKGYVGAWKKTIGFGENRYTKPLFMKVVLFALAKTAKAMNRKFPPIFDVEAGLPSGDVNNKVIYDFLHKSLVGSHTVYVNNEAVRFEVADTVFYPQYIGTIANMAYRWIDGEHTQLEPVIDNFEDQVYGILDIGGATVLADRAVGLGINSRNSLGEHREGAYRLFKHLSSVIGVNESEADLLLRSKTFDDKYILNPDSVNPRDVTEEVLEGIARYTERIAALISKLFFVTNLSSTSADVDIEHLYLTGGGTYLLDMDYLRELLLEDYLAPKALTEREDFIVIVEEPESANVEGYYKIGALTGKGEFGQGLA